VFFLVADRGPGHAIRVVATPDQPGGVGRYVLQTLEDPRTARDGKLLAQIHQLLTWTYREQTQQLGDFPQLWDAYAPATRDALQLAAAPLAQRTQPDRVLAVATRCASSLPAAPRLCHLLQLAAYEAKQRWADAVAQGELLAARWPDTVPRWVNGYVYALTQAGRLADAERLLTAERAQNPGDDLAQVAWVTNALAHGDGAEAVRRADAYVQLRSTHGSNNEAAWVRVITGLELAAGLSYADRAVALEDVESTRNTRAAVRAELGQLEPAIEDLHHSFALHRTVLNEDWYVYGRIYEQAGLLGDAIAAYQRMTPVASATSTYALAQRRLSALQSGVGR
jgi:hypothetical protein